MKSYIVFDIETTGLNPWYDSYITCICAKSSDGKFFKKVLFDCTESDLIYSFIDWLDKNFDLSKIRLVSKNGKGFDIPFILTRSFLLDIYTSFYSFLTKYDHYDLQELTFKWITLDDLAKILNCPQKSGYGFNAIKFYNEGRISELLDYCWNDVIVTEACYLKIKELRNEKDN